MSSNGFELNIKQRIHELEVERRDAERQLQLAQATVEDRETRLSHWYGALRDYQESNGLPVTDSENGQVAVDEYARLGPTQIVAHWANTHNGEIVIKDVVQVVLRAGVYGKYRTAYNSIRATVKRGNYEQIGPGHFRALQKRIEIS